MTQLIEQLADLTRFRDRDMLDVSVVQAVNDARPQSLGVSIYRCIGESGARRWLKRAHIGPGEPAPIIEPAGLDVSALPLLADVPARHECVLHAKVVRVSGSTELTIFPILTEREVIGVLELRTRETLSPSDCLLVTTVLRLYGNFHELLDYSERDALTGLLNRQTFEASFLKRAQIRPPDDEVEPQGRRRSNAECEAWLGLIDIDHFKRVNDTYGHLIGDEVLLLLSRLMNSSFRYRDRLYRFGGEEFVVMLNSVGKCQAALALERLRANIERFVFPQIGHITVSVGFTRVEKADAPSAAFARADKALYHAKGHGRNQVVSFEELVRAGGTAEAAISGDIELF